MLREWLPPILSPLPTVPSLLNHFEKKEGFLESFPLVEGDGVRCLPITAAAAPSTIEDTADEEKSFLWRDGELPALAVPDGKVPCLGGGNGFLITFPNDVVSDLDEEMLSSDF